MGVVLLGKSCQSGTYLLRIQLKADLRLTIGRFNNGDPLFFCAGEYLYVGSAMGTKGASTLGRRLLRHARRSDTALAHPIHAEMLAIFQQHGLESSPVPPRTPKKLFWHIDYLLDQPTVELSHVFAMRNTIRLEAKWAQQLMADHCTAIVAQGLGASDAAGQTHLLQLQPCTGSSCDNWWHNFIQKNGKDHAFDLAG